MTIEQLRKRLITRRDSLTKLHKEATDKLLYALPCVVDKLEIQGCLNDMAYAEQVLSRTIGTLQRQLDEIQEETGLFGGN